MVDIKTHKNYGSFDIAFSATGYARRAFVSYIKPGFYEIHADKKRYNIALPHIYIITTYDTDYPERGYVYCSDKKLRNTNNDLCILNLPNINSYNGQICMPFPRHRTACSSLNDFKKSTRHYCYNFLASSFQHGSEPIFDMYNKLVNDEYLDSLVLEDNLLVWELFSKKYGLNAVLKKIDWPIYRTVGELLSKYCDNY